MNWPRVQLKQITALGPQYGANASGAPWTGSRPRYIRITDIDQDGRLLEQGAVEADTENVSEYTLQEGDLLFARSGNTVGKTYRYSSKSGPSVFAGYLIRFRLDPRLGDSKFVFFFTQSPNYKAWVSSKKRVAGQPNVNGSEYATLSFPLPTLREQQRIVEILEQADALRQKRAGADTLSDRILPALFNHYFGEPTANSKGWPVSPLHELADFVSGATPSKENAAFWNGNIPWVSPKDMKREELYDAIDHVSESALTETKLKLLPQDTALIVVRGMILVHTVPVCLARVPVTINQDMKGLRPKGGATSEFLQWALLAQHSGLLRLVSTAAHGTRKLDIDALGNLQIPVPPPPQRYLIEKWTGIVREQQAASRKRSQCRESIEQIWRIMLHHAFTGKLTTQWREAHMNELLAEMEQQTKVLKQTGGKP